MVDLDCYQTAFTLKLSTFQKTVTKWQIIKLYLTNITINFIVIKCVIRIILLIVVVAGVVIILILLNLSLLGNVVGVR